MATSSVNFSIPSASTVFGHDDSGKYPKLLTDSTNFRIKKIMDDEKLLQDEIKNRNGMCKKYGRLSTVTDGLEYSLILADIVVGVVAASIPGVGNMISSATFSGVGSISGVAKLVQSKLNEKKMKHYRLSVIASTTLNNLHRKIKKATIDGDISHEEFEDIQNTINEWKKGPVSSTEQPALNQETINLLNKQAAEKAQKEILEQLKQLNMKK
jgi:hypothetical protein